MLLLSIAACGGPAEEAPAPGEPAPAGGGAARDAGFADVPGGQLHYEIVGAGHPVVLIHGGFMDGRMWNDQIGAFARHFRVLRYDVRGYGRSSAPFEPFSPAEDLRALLDALQIHRAHLVGQSMGGGIAIDFALAHPDRVLSLVLAEPGIGGFAWSSEITRSMRLVFETAAQEGKARGIEVFLEQPVFATARGKAAALRQIRLLLEANFMRQPDPVAFMKALNPPAVGRLAEIHVPTLGLISEHAAADARAINDLFAGAVPDFRSVTIPDAGHMMNMEQPGAFNEAVLEFLRQR